MKKVLLSLTLCLFVAGCRPVTTTTPPAALAPGAVNRVDQTSYQTLLTLQAALRSLKGSIASDPSLAPLLPAFEQARKDYNVAEAAWQIYHAAATAANQATLDAALTGVKTDVNNLQKEVHP